MNYIDLFSGIGGFALGAHWSGFKADNHFFSEIDEYSIELYKKRFHDAVFLGDIKKIDCDFLKKHYGSDWVITGGFPCQDISIAGKGAGLDGERSGLWFEMWRIIRELRPKFVIAENVSAITFRGLDRVASSLAEIGYSAEWQDIRASDMGAPHRRERIWIVAYPNASDFIGSKHGQQHKGTKKFNGSRKDKLGSWDEVANSYGSQCQGDGHLSLRRSPQHADASLPGWWQVEPAVGRMVDGLPHRVDRLKGLGNSIVPQIAEMLFKRCLTAI